MPSRALPLLVLACAAASLGAAYRSEHFVVEAPTRAVAERVARAAERQRKELALRWRGRELPDWTEPCTIEVELHPRAVSGCTSISFDEGQVSGHKIEVRGPLDRILRSILPHEMTHVVFADHLRAAPPRWADEGGAILGEARRERDFHERMAARFLAAPVRLIPLRDMLPATEYPRDPRDVGVLYSEGYSVARFLVEREGHTTFLAFLRQGMAGDWDRAIKAHYRYKDVEHLEAAWVRWVRREGARPHGRAGAGGPAPRSSRLPQPGEPTALPPVPASP